MLGVFRENLPSGEVNLDLLNDYLQVTVLHVHEIYLSVPQDEECWSMEILLAVVETALELIFNILAKIGGFAAIFARSGSPPKAYTLN